MEVIAITCQFILLISVINGVICETERDDCPVGNYRCNSSQRKVCIALSSICDGKQDCPNGDDELSSYCKQVSLTKHYKDYNPGRNYVKESVLWAKNPNPKLTKSLTRDGNWADGENPYWINSGCVAGHYLCNGTLNICVKLRDLCNGHQDCPHADDEDKEICENWSQPKSNQPKNVKPSQPNDKQHFEANWPQSESNGLTQNEIANEWSQPAKINEFVDKLVGNRSPHDSKNFGGTGFMFHVNNLIIYNSEVRMFNQNSDNNKSN